MRRFLVVLVVLGLLCFLSSRLIFAEGKDAVSIIDECKAQLQRDGVKGRDL